MGSCVRLWKPSVSIKQLQSEIHAHQLRPERPQPSGPAVTIDSALLRLSIFSISSGNAAPLRLIRYLRRTSPHDCTLLIHRKKFRTFFTDHLRRHLTSGVTMSTEDFFRKIPKNCFGHFVKQTGSSPVTCSDLSRSNSSHAVWRLQCVKWSIEWAHGGLTLPSTCSILKLSRHLNQSPCKSWLIDHRYMQMSLI